jgi:hypothetical protein
VERCERGRAMVGRGKGEGRGEREREREGERGARETAHARPLVVGSDLRLVD